MIMRKLFTICLTLILCGAAANLFGQTRYLDEVFSTVKRTDSVVYGVNVSVLTMGAQNLVMNIYEPDGDTATDRPMVLLFPTGNFLPAILNGSPNGNLDDSTVVEICNRLAKRGYVAAACFNRHGWLAQNPDQSIQTATLLQAAYRGIQDGRTAVRFAKKTVAEDGNPYGIDAKKIIMGGIGTGGYISLGCAYLNTYDEIKLAKFTDFTTGQPYVDTTVHGNIWGTNMTMLNLPNHTSYSSDFLMAFNLGGALGDSTWVDDGEIPAVSFHTPQDPNAPYDIGIVIVPTTGNTVIDQAAGSFAVARINNRFGNNDVFVNAMIMDAYTTAANTLNSGYEGLMPFNRPLDPMGTWDCPPLPAFPHEGEGAPWDWWNEAAFIAAWDATGSMTPGFAVNCDQRAGNPDMSAMKGRLYVDSVMGYLSPRMVAALNSLSTDIEDVRELTQFQAFPNPAKTSITLASDVATPILGVVIYDLAGRQVYASQKIMTSQVELDRGGLNAGVYMVKVVFKDGVVTEKVVFE